MWALGINPNSFYSRRPEGLEGSTDNLEQFFRFSHAEAQRGKLLAQSQSYGEFSYSLN